MEDEQILSNHPELLPDLKNALALLKKIQLSFQHGSTSETSIDATDKFYIQQSEFSPWHLKLPLIDGYKLLQPIRRGGQSIVFLAIQESTRKRVAIKVLDGGAFVTPRKLERFEREVVALVRLDHPGIVRIVDRGRTSDGSYFIAMDLVDGEDLDVYLEQRRIEGWNVRQVVQVFAKIAAALGEAHRVGIIHRDVKPSNIRLDARGDPRILDFGLARLKAVSDEELVGFVATQTGGIVGSLPWASPEQASGDSAKLCSGSDVYSLGVALFHALTGHSPYDLSGTLREQMRNICEVVPRFPISRRTSLPFGFVDPILVGIIHKCLEKQPTRRYIDGLTLAAALEDYLAKKIRTTSFLLYRARGVMAMAALLAVFGIAIAFIVVNPPITTTSKTNSIKLPAFKNSIGMELLLIPAESFYAGGASGMHQSEEPLHKVTLTHPYFIAQTEITRSEYHQVMGSLPSLVATLPNDDLLPVDYISRDQAENFCQRLSQKEGRHYRLPTEMEWENACRAGVNFTIIENEPTEQSAWCSTNSKGHIQPVALKHPNNWGLFDMQGNVSEWCADQFVEQLDSRVSVDPFEAPRSHPFLGVVRGGSYLDSASNCAPVTRFRLRSDQSIKGVGFRVVMDVSTQNSSTSH